MEVAFEAFVVNYVHKAKRCNDVQVKEKTQQLLLLFHEKKIDFDERKKKAQIERVFR